jgi:hypothetical protein
VQVLLTFPVHLISSPVFTGVRVAQSLIGAFVIIIIQELILNVENPRV